MDLEKVLNVKDKAVIKVGFYWRTLVVPQKAEPPHEIIEVEYEVGDKVPSKKDVILKALSQRVGGYPRSYATVIISGSEYLLENVKSEEVTGNFMNGVEEELVKVFNAIIPTSSRTVVYREKDYQYNAPHHFVVKSRWETELARINFQEGPIDEEGVNGVTNEDLIAIVIERLQGFQASPFSCRDNALAITHLEDALFRLANRTREREARGVEGTHTP